jgi:hypothetical protein
MDAVEGWKDSCTKGCVQKDERKNGAFVKAVDGRKTKGGALVAIEESGDDATK